MEEKQESLLEFEIRTPEDAGKYAPITQVLLFHTSKIITTSTSYGARLC